MGLKETLRETGKGDSTSRNNVLTHFHASKVKGGGKKDLLGKSTGTIHGNRMTHGEKVRSLVLVRKCTRKTPLSSGPCGEKGRAKEGGRRGRKNSRENR